MGLHGIRQLVDGSDGGVGCGIKADGIVRAADIVVNGCRNADCVDAGSRELACAAEGAVTADGNNPVESKVVAGVDRHLKACIRFKLLAARGVEHGAAAGRNPIDRARVKLDDVRMDQAVVAAVDSHRDDAVLCAGAYCGADCRVHSRRIAAPC